MLKLCVYEVLRMALQDLVGKCFSVAEGEYRIVDVRNIAGDALVYAEKRQGAACRNQPTVRPGRGQ